jgi:AdoMet-dependent heme synthase
MSTLMERLNAKAIKLGVPLSVHLDLTYRCNERCVHCYLDHDDNGEMSEAEIMELLPQLADAGALLLTLSGGEPLLRKDLFRIIARARERNFSVKLKTNGILIREAEARRLQELCVDNVQISVYSHRPEVHDAITKVPGSLAKTIASIRFLRGFGLKLTIAHVIMRQNRGDLRGTQALAKELGCFFTVDPTITPHINGSRHLLALNIPQAELAEVMRDRGLVGDVDAFCAVPGAVSEDDLDSVPCSAGHASCYISPYGDVFPCVQFPLPSGNVRAARFIDIWRHSPQLKEVRSITARDLPVCSTCAHVATCTRCPGLAYSEGNMRGPSSQDCQKSFARTGVPTANMRRLGLTAETAE